GPARRRLRGMARGRGGAGPRQGASPDIRADGIRPPEPTARRPPDVAPRHAARDPARRPRVIEQGRERARLDRTVLLERRDLVVPIAELAEDLLRVLATLRRRGSDDRRRALEIHAVTDQPDRPEGLAHHRTLDRQEPDLRVLEGLLH